MKIPSLICLFSLAAQALAVSARLEAGNVTYTNDTTLKTLQNMPASRSIPTTLVTPVDDSPSSNTSSSRTSHLEPRRPAIPAEKTYRNTVFFGSWTDPAVLDTLPWLSITHVLYGYASINSNGTVYSPHPKRDERNVKLLRQIKLRYRHVKVFLSIGGFANSQPPENEFEGAVDMAWRQQFADSAVDMMQHYGFEGIDIAWAYPVQMGFEFLNLLETTRWALNDYQDEHGVGFKFLMTIEVSIEAELYRMDWVHVDGIVDVWYLMSYDHSGAAWSLKSSHHANIYNERLDAIQPSVSAALIKLTWRQANPQKMMLGIPLYGRSFIQKGKEFGSDFEKPKGEDDIILFKDINPDNDWDCGVDYEMIAAWCHDGTRLISYDNMETVQLKVEWLLTSGMRGMMFYHAEGDIPGWDNSLIEAATEQLPSLDGYPNQLHFPLSKFNFTSFNDTNKPGGRA